MPVYFIRSGDTGPVKIGWAADVEKRRRQLQTNHPYPLQVLRTVPTRRGTERWLQRHYEATQLLGEWFVFDAGMLTIEPPDLAAKLKPKKRNVALLEQFTRPMTADEFYSRPTAQAVENMKRHHKKAELNRLIKLHDKVVADYRRRNGHG